MEDEGNHRLDLATRSSSSFFCCLKSKLVTSPDLHTQRTDLDSIRVRRALGSVDELIGEALGDGLDVAEGGFTRLYTEKTR